jgi:hypothetical protein
MDEPRDRNFWSVVDKVFAEMDSSWYGLKLAIIHNAIINVRVLIYREFFQQDVEEFGFEEAGTDQIVIDPGLTVD